MNQQLNQSTWWFGKTRISLQKRSDTEITKVNWRHNFTLILLFSLTTTLNITKVQCHKWYFNEYIYLFIY